MFKPSTLSIVALSLAAGVVFTVPASAQQAKDPKQKKQVASQNVQRANPSVRGPEARGGLYYQGYYLGDDPDPFIRLQIMRDLGARFPGNE